MDVSAGSKERCICRFAQNVLEELAKALDGQLGNNIPGGVDRVWDQDMTSPARDPSSGLSSTMRDAHAVHVQAQLKRTPRRLAFQAQLKCTRIR